MDEIGTAGVEFLPPRDRRKAAFVPIAPRAAFVSQLIAGPQSVPRPAAAVGAFEAYAARVRLAVRRLPPGYRTCRDV